MGTPSAAGTDSGALLQAYLNKVPYEGGLVELVPGHSYVPFGFAIPDITEPHTGYVHLLG